MTTGSASLASRARGAAWLVCSLTTTCALAGLVLTSLEPTSTRALPADFDGGIATAALEMLVLTTLATLGAIVASHEPRNAIGWLLTLIAFSLGCLTLSSHAYSYVLHTAAGSAVWGDYAAWLSGWAWIPAVVTVFTVFPLLYPTGHPLSRRWRPLLWLAVLAQLVTFLGTAFVAGPLDEHPEVSNPVGVGGGAIEALGMVGFFVLVPVAIASIASLGVRFRRAGETERQQIKWVVAAAATLPVAFSGAGLSGDAGYPLLLVALLLIGVAVAVAMLRYRLYDIEVVVNRALVYVALSATLAATYFIGVLVLQLVLGAVTSESRLAVAGSTLAVVAVFQPARHRIQSLVDRRFYRHRYDAALTLEDFGARLRDELDLDAVGSELRSVVAETMQPAHVSLWLRPAGDARNASRTSRP